MRAWPGSETFIASPVPDLDATCPWLAPQLPGVELYGRPQLEEPNLATDRILSATQNSSSILARVFDHWCSLVCCHAACCDVAWVHRKDPFASPRWHPPDRLECWTHSRYESWRVAEVLRHDSQRGRIDSSQELGARRSGFVPCDGPCQPKNGK